MMKKVILVLCLIVSSTAQSAPITHNGYTLNEDTNIVTGGGLEWLQWDETIGMSINEALLLYAAAGWDLATNTQMNTLFEAFSFNTSPSESDLANTFSPYTVSDDTSYDHFITLFGTTWFVDNDIDPTIGRQTNAIMASIAFFGDDANNDDFYNLAVVLSDYTFNNGQSFNTDNEAQLQSDLNDQFTRSPTAGVALVRPVAVPAPATLAIFALGILGLGMRRKVCG